MKRNIITTLLFTATLLTANAQISPQSYTATHSDSSWVFTFDYDTPKPPSGAGMLIVTHLCTPDTCVSTAERHIQGKRYARQYVKRNGVQPALQRHGPSSYTLVVPEEAVSDTVYGITYCEYSDRHGTGIMCDTVTLTLPQCPPMSCHRVESNKSIADHIAANHPQVQSIRYYTPLTNASAADVATTPSTVRYRSNSSKLDPSYLQNARSIDEVMQIIGDILADSTTTIEAIQIAGYTQPDGSEDKATQRGYNRATALRDHIRRHHQLPDSVFEIAGGGNNWNLIYRDIAEINVPGGNELIAQLQQQPDDYSREKILKRYDNGALYKILQERYFPAHRMACCTGIYYRNSPDSIAQAINEIVDELPYTPSPNYEMLIAKLKHFTNDARALNLEGVLEYRRHRRHAAEKAFAKAAKLGDTQALLNLEIVENEKNMQKELQF